MINFYQFLEVLDQNEPSANNMPVSYQDYQKMPEKEKNILVAQSMIENGYSFVKKLGELVLTAYGPGALPNPDESVAKLKQAFAKEFHLAEEFMFS